MINFENDINNKDNLGRIYKLTYKGKKVYDVIRKM